MVGNIDVSPGSRAYAVFYLTALRFLERDPYRDVAFAVLPNVNSGPLLHLYLWNQTLVF